MKKIIMVVLFFDNIVAMVENNNNIISEIQDVPLLPIQETLTAGDLEEAG